MALPTCARGPPRRLMRGRLAARLARRVAKPASEETTLILALALLEHLVARLGLGYLAQALCEYSVTVEADV